MTGEIVFNAYTTTYNGLSNKLINEVEISSGTEKSKEKALWDTGATGTCISEELAEKLNLVPTGKINMQTPAGASVVNTYLVDVCFPNNVVIKDIKVCGTKIGEQGIQALIGMDIITLGDFAVSNYNGSTMFSFRIPSKQHTDYVKQIQLEKAIGPKHGPGKRKKKSKKKKR